MQWMAVVMVSSQWLKRKKAAGEAASAGLGTSKHGKHAHVTRGDTSAVRFILLLLYHLTLHDHHVHGTEQASRVKQGSIRRS
jgi:hypothetical protein